MKRGFLTKQRKRGKEFYNKDSSHIFIIEVNCLKHKLFLKKTILNTLIMFNLRGELPRHD